ncbi:NAD(P)/FAD-dependent oxidoreductase [Aquabacterium humicola]|uniref:NAD(P)/FAD-dependent oxidoreductase n=1 Tax=Aquabacterium humicola TaxID=3237377 RepID=UPI00254373DC|nr:FAD-dependent oxidoreductase [Rubrivivax pictus]
MASGRFHILVLGAGIVGVATALQLARRGHAVALVDRRAPGRETSHGNAGIIQREAVVPYAFPRQWPALIDAALRRGAAVNWHLRALPGLAAPLARYWWHSAPARHRRIADDYARLIAHCQDEHAALLHDSEAEPLLRRDGFRIVFRTPAALAEAVAHADDVARRYGVRHAVLDGAALASAEPALRPGLAGALHWLDPWTVSDPGELVRRYAQRFRRLGGELHLGDATSLQPDGAGWRVRTAHGALKARHAVIALGPWSAALTQRLGYRLPLFVKRGYHRHFGAAADRPSLQLPLLDAERGYVLAPMARGIRLSTGAEFARLGAPPSPVQLQRALQAARGLLPLGEPVDDEIWLGNRPCTPDMKPVIGSAPKHPGLWFNFGHAHQGFTLGPVSGRLIADMIDGVPPLVDAGAFSPARFAA